VHVSGPLAKSKSEECAKKLGHKDFKADGCLVGNLGKTVNSGKHKGRTLPML
jgi:hypothetical protein